MKSLISVFFSVILLFSMLGIQPPAYANSNTSLEKFSNEMFEVNSDELDKGKSVEDYAKCRVIVKATSNPYTYENAKCVVGNNNRYIYQYSDTETAQKAVEYYNSLPYVKWAEIDGIVEGKASSYGNPMIQSDDAIEYIIKKSLPENEVKVAMLDTGAGFGATILRGRVFDSGVNLSDSGTEGSAKADNVHGTHTASIVVDNTPENVKIYAYKVLDRFGYGSNLSVALGIDMAVADGADIINLSLVSYKYSQLVYDSIKDAYDAGVIIVCAAGNEQCDTSKSYPAAFDEVYTVGSIDINGNASLYTNFGDEIDFVAPGHYVEVTSTKVCSGTSYSAPFITAAVAILLSINPDYDSEQIKQLLIDSCIPYEYLKYHDGFHSVEDYNPETTDNFAFMYEYNEDERLYYGNGMPQILNAISIAQKDIVSPIISEETGIYHESFDVTIDAPEGCEIYYTTNESYPTKNNAKLYTEPITISYSQSIRAVAYSADGVRSNPVSREYKMEYFADEKDFTINSSGYITGYSGELAEFVVPDSINGITVTGVDEGAFYRNKNIIGITFPDTMTYIGIEALSSSSIKYVTAPGLTYIDESGLQADNLIYLNAPKLEKIEFGGLSTANLRQIEFPNLKYAGTSAFGSNKNVKTVVLPELEYVSAAMFTNCYVLKSVRLDKATVVDAGAFSNCYWLKIVDIPNLEAFLSTEYSPFSTFYQCNNLVDVSFEKLTTLTVTNCFESCSHLKNVHMPSVKSIPYKTFAGCSDLENISLKSTEQIDGWAFKSVHSYSMVLDIPNVTHIEENAFDDCFLMLLDAPSLVSAKSFPKGNGTSIVLSSKFQECTFNAKGYNITIYGTPDTYAQTYAEQNGLTFINAPAIINDLPSEYFEGTLTFDVAGFNKIYRWFGTNNENGTGVKLLSTSTTEKDFDPSDFNYKYYFSIILSRDNGYNRSVKTSLCENTLYSSTPIPDARVTIATPSERTVKYGESIVLYANATGLPEGAKIKWRIVEGSGVTLDPSASGTTCTVTSKSNGQVTIEAYAVDKNGNSIVNKKGNRVYDREGITSEVSLWWIILYYIKQMFSVTKTTLYFF